MTKISFALSKIAHIKENVFAILASLLWKFTGDKTSIGSEKKFEMSVSVARMTN